MFLPVGEGFALPQYSKNLTIADTMGVFDMARVRGYSTPTFHAAENRRSGNNYHTLHICTRDIPSVIHTQLAIQVFRARPCGSDCLGSWCCPNSVILRLLLDLLHKVSSSFGLSSI